MTDLVSTVRRHRALCAVSFDVAAWLASFAVFTWLRYETEVSEIAWTLTGWVAAGTVLVYLVLARLVRLHHGRAATASLDELVLLSFAVLGATAVSFGFNFVETWVPRSVPLAAGLSTLVAGAWARSYWVRLSLRGPSQQPGTADTGTPVLIVGAGEGARELVSSMTRDPQRTWRPLGLLDDDPRKRHRRLSRVPVLGRTDELVEVAQGMAAEAVIVAIPSASRDFVARMRRLARDAGVPIKILPAATQLLHEHVGIRDLRDINLSDVLGRSQLDTDVAAIAGYLTGRRVLVTGAGGSIGAELCRQIQGYAPGELMMLDRDESALHAVQLSLTGRALLDSSDVVLCDIRDARAVREIFARRRPEVVFHAAALKHLPMLEQYPAEAVKTNVIGTLNVLDAAEASGVDRFVNISTDKAANPSSVLGYSKRVAEQLTSQRAVDTGRHYLSVRFGNVLGSRGSVLTSFARQIAEGGPVTVTDPDVARYFMTIEEACQLVVQAAAIGRPGEALVLDMGSPVKIADMARQLIEQHGAEVEIVYTGLRPGEKMHEELFADTEPSNVRPAHPMVSHVPVPPLGEGQAYRLALGQGDELRTMLAEACLVPHDETARRQPRT